MGNTTQTFRGSASLENPVTITVYNVSVTLAATEVSQTLTAGTKQFTIKVRGNRSTLQLAFVVGESATKFLTIPARATYTATDINFSGTLFFQTDLAAQTVEIVEWST